MRKILAFSVLSFGLSWPQISLLQEEQSDGPVFVMRHPPRLVYFERAPRNIRAAVEAEMDRTCSNPELAQRDRNPDDDDATELICGGSEYTVMHAVDYRRQTNGYAYACLTDLLEEDEVFPLYYEEYFNAPFRCVVFFDETATMEYRVEREG